MELQLIDNRTQGIIYDYKPTEKQWWINGFDPKHQDMQKNDLTAITKIYFSDFEQDLAMWNAFKNNYDAKMKWKFDEKNRVAILKW